MDDKTLITYSYVNISSYRAKTVKALKDEVKVPTKIAADAGLRPNHISGCWFNKKYSSLFKTYMIYD